MYIATEYLASENRPIEGEWTAEQLARFAACRAEQVAAAQARAAAKRQSARFTLESAHEVVTFRVEASADAVTILRTDRMGTSSRRPIPAQTLNREGARAEWARLIDAGYWRW